MKPDDSIYTDSTTRRSPYTLTGPMPKRYRPLDVPAEEIDYGVFWRFWIMCLLIAGPLWLVIVGLWWLTSTLVQARGI